MKKYLLLIIVMIAAITIPVACSSGESRPDDIKVTETPSGVVSPEPTAEPSPSVSPSPIPSPTPSPTPTPTPIPELKDVWEETDEPNMYSLPGMDLTGYYFNAFIDSGKLLYFLNEDYASEPEIISYDYTTDTTVHKTLEGVEANEYRFYVIPDKYIVINDGSKTLHYLDFDLKEIRSVEIPIKSAYPEFWADETYENLYFVEADELKKFNAASGETVTIAKNSLYKDSYPSGITPDGKYLKVYVYSWKKGYSVAYLADINTGELTRDDDATDYLGEYYISPDKKEILVSDGEKNRVMLYDIDPDNEELMLKLDQNIFELDTEPKAVITLNDYYDIIAKVDWTNRKLLTHARYSIGDYLTIEYKCYDLDTAKKHSSSIISVDSGVYTDYSMCIDEENGYVIIGGNRGNAPFAYVWDYLNDEVNTDNTDFRRINYIPDYLDEHRKELEEKYNMYIYLGSEIFATETDYTLSCCKSASEMDAALYIVDEVLSLYPEGFFEQIKYGNIRTIGLYLCNGFTKKASYGIDNAIALAGTDGYERFLVLDISYPSDLRRNIIHEISHWIDNRINQQDDLYTEESFENLWSELNPSDFYYMNDYNKASPFYRYTYGSAKAKAYFVDSYSMSKATEDRARLFEYLMRYDKEYGSKYMESEAMRKKLHMYFENIRKCFDTTGWPDETIWEHKLNQLDRLYDGDESLSYEIIYPEMNGDEKTYLSSDDRWFLDAYSGSAYAFG